MAEDEEEDQTLIAAPMPVGLRHGPDPDALPAEDETLIAIPRAFVRAAAPPPRPAAGLPPATPPPPRPPSSYPPPRPAAGLPPAAHPPMRAPPAAPTGFVPIDRTAEMPKVMVPAYVPRPLPAPPPPAQQAAAPASAPTLPLPLPPPPPPLPPPSSTVVLAAPEGMPALVVRFVLLCGLVAVLGLLALIYLQL